MEQKGTEHVTLPFKRGGVNGKMSEISQQRCRCHCTEFLGHWGALTPEQRPVEKSRRRGQLFSSFSQFDQGHLLADFIERRPFASHNGTQIAVLRQATLAFIAETQRAAGITETSLLNFVVTDGHTMLATRCVFPETEMAASLYYSEGSAFQRSLPQEPSTPVAAGQPDRASLESRASARDTSVTGICTLQASLLPSYR